MKKMTIFLHGILVLLVLSISACSNIKTWQEGLEKVNIEGPISDRVDIKWIKVKSYADANAVCKALGIKVSSEYYIQACSISMIVGEARRCLIVSLVPEYVRGDEAMDSLGHEMLHCFAGEFHK